MTINFNAPFNSTSIGQTSYNIYKALAKNNDVCLFPYGDKIDLGCFKVNEDEKNKLQSDSRRSETGYCRKNPSLNIWHIRGSERGIGAEQNLFTFHETDALTPYEINRLSQQKTVFVSSQYTKTVFDFYLNSSTEVVYCPLGFDSDSFYRIEKKEEDFITFGIRGKLEKRKHSLKVIGAWAKTFGGDPRYRLDCSVYNPFCGEEQMAEFQNAMPDKTIPWNINILPFLPTNELYNKALNQADIDLTGMSGCEGFNLPLFQSLCLGKQAIVLNAHVHKDYCNANNSILVEPANLAIEADDGKFFIKGHPVNQGRWYDFNEKDLIDAMVFAAEKGRVRNVEGEKLAGWTFDIAAKIIERNIR